MNNILKELSLKCCKCGKCCRFTINITPFDIWRIERKTGLNPRDFTLVVTRPDRFGGRYIQFLMKLTNSNCIFLSENICKINDFKPITCRLFPFREYEDGEIHWMHDHVDFIKQNCDISLDNSDNIQYYLKKYTEINYYIKKYNEEINEFQNFFNVWHSSLPKGSKINIYNFLDFLDRYKNNYVDDDLTDEKLTKFLNDSDTLRKWNRQLNNNKYL